MPAKLIVVLLGAAVVLAAAFALRGAIATVVPDEVDGITVECTGWTGVSTGCAAWGEEILAAGPPSNTFEMEDVVRLRLDRRGFGFGRACEAAYFLSRYPDEPAWTDEVACRAP